MIGATIMRDPDTGQIVANITKEYALAFDILDNGFPLPVDLEMTLNEQGYSVEHLYEIHNH